MHLTRIHTAGVAVAQRRCAEQYVALAGIWLVWIIPFFVIPSARADKQPREIQDADITAAIVAGLASNETIVGDAVKVAVREGVVTLSGSVGHLLAQDQAQRIAEHTRGVRAVINKIDVQPVRRADDEIEADIKRALLLDPATYVYKVDVRVRGGRATLTGVVESWAEKQRVDRLVKSIRGVAEVENEIRVEYDGPREDRDIQSEIERRLQYSPYLDAESIEVAVDDGIVSLSGVVYGLHAKAKAVELAWVVGVADVVSGALEIVTGPNGAMVRPTEMAAKSDEAIEAGVRSALSYDPRVSDSAIDITSTAGTVTLTGTVDNLQAKRAAERDARNTIGVWKVENRLEVRPVDPPSHEVLIRHVEESLARDAVLGSYSFTVLVRDKRIHLYGEVPTYYVRNRAEEAAARVPGVVAIDNHIQVTPSPTTKSDRQIREEIENQLFWSMRVDGGDILVDVTEGVATLHGRVNSWDGLKTAVEIAFQAGARAVDNELEIRDAPPQIYPQRYYPWLFWGM